MNSPRLFKSVCVSAFHLLSIVIGSLAFALSAQADPLAYVSNRDSDSVSVIDISTNAIIATIGVGAGPQYIELSPDGSLLYTGNAIGDNVSVIDTSTNAVLATIPTGAIPHGVAFTPDGAFAYVTNKDSDNVTVIDTTTNAVVATIYFGSRARPAGVVVTRDGTRAYIANEFRNFVSVIDVATNTILGEPIPVPGGPLWLALSPNGSQIYIPQIRSNSVAVLDVATNALVASVPVGQSPITVTFSPDGSRAYVSNNGSGTVSVIDTTMPPSVVATIAVGTQPVRPAVTADGSLLYVPIRNGTVTVVDTQSGTIVDSIVVQNGPWSAVIAPVVYECVGFDAPMNKSAVRVKKNRALPLKAQLLQSDGTPVTDLNITASPVLQVLFESVGQSAEDVTSDAVPLGLGTDGNQFEFDVDRWRFNLSTKSYTASGTYRVSIQSGDNYSIEPGCEATFVIQ